MIDAAMPPGVAAVIVAAAAPSPASLERRLEWAREAGAGSAVVCVPSGVKSLRERFDSGEKLGLPLRFFVEDQPLGTAGAVKALGAASLPEDVLVIACEDAPRFDGARMLAFHAGHDALATLAVHRCRHQPPCQPVVLGPGRRVVDLPARPAEGGYAFGLSAAWLVRRPLLRLAGEPPCDFARDVFPKALKAGEPLAGFSA